MLFLMPFDTILWIYILAAVLPAIFLMIYVYNQDSIEKEPASLLWACVGRGVLAALVSIVLEMIGEKLLGISGIQNKVTYTVVMDFLVVAAVEEGTKYFFMSRLTWHNPNFNYRFDGIVYSVFTSLGFAAFENVKYVFSYGLQVAGSRAILAIPAHMGFSVIFGLFYGRAKRAADCGENVKKVVDLIIGYLLAVGLHGLYDTSAMLHSGKATATFVGVVAVVYVIIIVIVKREARTDEPV